MHIRFTAIAAATLLAATTAAPTAGAAGPAPSIRNTEQATSQRTAADYANAKTLMPKVNTLTEASFDYNAAAAMAAVSKPVVFAGQRGGAKADHLARTLTLTDRSAPDSDVSPEAVGTGGMHFTSSRVSPKALDTTFPVRTVGKLYFKIGTASYMCSGSMIKPGVVVTSGHCIHSGNGAASGWYNSFEFIPGYRKAGSTITQPYGSWTNWSYASTTLAWYNGGGGVPNTGDWAVIVFGADSSGKRIGDYTGWLGYGTGLAVGRHSTVLGYPGNLDKGGQLHRIDAMTTDYGSLNNVNWGSDMQGGSSGGPVVLNWRVDYKDTSTLPSENAGNIVTSTVSWGYVSSLPKVQGGSAFDANFLNLINGACSSVPTAC